MMLGETNFCLSFGCPLVAHLVNKLLLLRISELTRPLTVSAAHCTYTLLVHCACSCVSRPGTLLQSIAAGQPLTCLRGWRPASAAALPCTTSASSAAPQLETFPDAGGGQHAVLPASQQGHPLLGPRPLCSTVSLGPRPTGSVPLAPRQPAGSVCGWQVRRASTSAASEESSALESPAVRARLAKMQARHAELCAELSSAPSIHILTCPILSHRTCYRTA